MQVSNELCSWRFFKYIFLYFLKTFSVVTGMKEVQEYAEVSSWVMMNVICSSVSTGLVLLSFVFLKEVIK